MYYFKKPSDDFKILFLKPENLDIPCFVDFNSVVVEEKIRKEWFNLRAITSDKLIISIVRPSYKYLPEEAKDEFVDRYKSFFPELLDLFHTLLVYSNSKSS
jgi:hypothetical protein